MASPDSIPRRRPVKRIASQNKVQEWTGAATNDAPSIFSGSATSAVLSSLEDSARLQVAGAPSIPESESWSSSNDGSSFVATNIKAGMLADPSPSSTAKPEVHEKRTDTLAIVLGIVFGIVFLLVVCLIAFLCIRRRKKHGSFIYQDNVSVASVDSYIATANPAMTALQKDVSTASSSPERATTQPAAGLETITEKSSTQTSPAVVQGQTSPVNAMEIMNAGTSNLATKSEAFPPYYPTLPAPHQLSSLGRRHSSEFAYVPNDPFYDSNVAIFELHMQQQHQYQQQQQKLDGPQHTRTRSRGSLRGNPSMTLEPLREYPEHKDFREPRNPLPQDPREQVLYNYRTSPERQPDHMPSKGQHRRQHRASLPATPDHTYRSSPDASAFRPTPDMRYRPSPEIASYRTSPDMSSYRPSPEMAAYRHSPDQAYRHSPELSSMARRSPEPQSLSHRNSPRSHSLHHPIPKPVAMQYNNPNWPWPQHHPAAMGMPLPPTSNPMQQASQFTRSNTTSLTPAAKYRAEMMRHKKRANHRRWTSEPHLLAANMRHPSIQRKPVPLPARTPIPPLEEVKLPAFWWEQQTPEDIGQSVEDLLLARREPLTRRFSFESRPTVS